MVYKVHDNVILEKVCGQDLLISFGETEAELPYIQQINETGSFYWKLLEKGYTVKQMLEAAEEEFGAEEEEIRHGLEVFLTILCQKGYISPENYECNSNLVP